MAAETFSWKWARTCICLDSVTACGMITNYKVVLNMFKACDQVVEAAFSLASYLHISFVLVHQDLQRSYCINQYWSIHMNDRQKPFLRNEQGLTACGMTTNYKVYFENLQGMWSGGGNCFFFGFLHISMEYLLFVCLFEDRQVLYELAVMVDHAQKDHSSPTLVARSWCFQQGSNNLCPQHPGGEAS